MVEKKTTKIENEVIRFHREAKELVEVQTNWKRKKLREQEGGIKNYYSGRFSSCKTYFPKKRVAKEQEKSTNFITLKRVKTSLGIRSKENK